MKPTKDKEVILTPEELGRVISSWDSAEHTSCGEKDRFLQYICQGQLAKLERLGYERKTE